MVVYLQLHKVSAYGCCRYSRYVVNGSKSFYVKYTLDIGINDKKYTHGRFYPCNMQCVLTWVLEKIKLTLGNRGFH